MPDHCFKAKDGGLCRRAGMAKMEIEKFMPPRKAAVVAPTVWRRRMEEVLGVREVMAAAGSYGKDNSVRVRVGDS